MMLRSSVSWTPGYFFANLATPNFANPRVRISLNGSQGHCKSPIPKSVKNNSFSWINCFSVSSSGNRPRSNAFYTTIQSITLIHRILTLQTVRPIALSSIAEEEESPFSADRICAKRRIQGRCVASTSPIWPSPWTIAKCPASWISRLTAFTPLLDTDRQINFRFREGMEDAGNSLCRGRIDELIANIGMIELVWSDLV